MDLLLSVVLGRSLAEGGCDATTGRCSGGGERGGEGGVARVMLSKALENVKSCHRKKADWPHNIASCIISTA